MSDEKQTMSVLPASPWAWPLDVTRYDQTPTLSQEEQAALTRFVQKPRDRAVVVTTAEQQVAYPLLRVEKKG